MKVKMSTNITSKLFDFLSCLHCGYDKSPVDCTIDLSPRGRLPSLCEPEWVGMKISFFFMEEDKSLWPCINYRSPNEITGKNWYPLPLNPSAFELLQRATIFRKLDLHNAYHLVRIWEGDKWKTTFNTLFGHDEYLVSNTPAVFQGLVNDVLWDMLKQLSFSCNSDILQGLDGARPTCTDGAAALAGEHFICESREV